MNILADKIALVTGASKGIGAAIAKDLAAAGASMIINYKTSKVGAEKTVADILGMGGKATAIQADLSQLAEIDRMFAAMRVRC